MLAKGVSARLTREKAQGKANTGKDEAPRTEGRWYWRRRRRWFRLSATSIATANHELSPICVSCVSRVLAICAVLPAHDVRWFRRRNLCLNVQDLVEELTKTKAGATAEQEMRLAAANDKLFAEVVANK